MRVIRPTYITDATLISCSIAEEDFTLYPEWDPNLSYQLGYRVTVSDAGVHKVYEAVCNNPENTNKYPPDWLVVRTGYAYVYWTILYATNRWKLFDLIVAPDRCDVPEGDALEIVVTPGEIDAVAILNADAESFTITLTDGGSTVHTETIVPSVFLASNIIFDNIPSYPSASVKVTCATSAGNTVKVGEIIFGKIKTLGTMKYGVDISIQDFSQKDTDIYGNFSVLERIYSKRIGCTFMIDIELHSGVFHFLQKYRAIPLVWIVSNLYSTTSLYGFYRDFSLTISNPSMVDCSITIEGLGGDLINATVPEEGEYIQPWDGSIKLWTFDLPLLADPVVDVLSPNPVENTPDDDELYTFAIPSISATTRLDNPIGTCTISNGSPAVVTKTAHGLLDDAIVIFHTTGALPAPLVVDRDYYVKNKADDTFNITLTLGGSTIDTTNAGSGTHSLFAKA